jgi:hypothetical protein
MLDQSRAYMNNPNRTMNWNLEPFIPLIEKHQSFYISAGSDQAIRDAVVWAEKQNVSIVLRIGPAAPQTMAPFLKAHNVSVILTNVLTTPANEDAFHASTYQAAGVLAKAGVPFAFSSGGYSNVRLIPFQAAMSVAWGLDHDAAIKALTINARRFSASTARSDSVDRQARQPRRREGDPLRDSIARITHVVILGRDVPLDGSKHVELFKRCMSR